MEKNLTIATLVKEVDRIYLDNSILSIDQSSKPNGHRYYETKSIAITLGAAYNYSKVPIRVLNRFYERTDALCELILKDSKFTASEAIIEEYRPLVNHLENAANHLHRKSSSVKRGNKEIILRTSLERCKDILATLNGRLTPLMRSLGEDGIQDIIRFIYEAKLHHSSDGSWVKRYNKVEKKPSKADAEISAQALLWSSLHQEKTAILTGDLDIINIIRNFEKYEKLAKLPKSLNEISARMVGVYLPNREKWDRELELTKAWPELKEIPPKLTAPPIENGLHN